MKTTLLLVLVFGLAIVGSAQTSAPAISRVTSNSQTQKGEVIYLKGSVEIVVGTVRVTADEADLHRDSGVIELRGIVRMQTQPDAAGQK